MNARVSVAVVTPLPPIRSGVADNNSELLPHLNQLVSVTAYTDPAIVGDASALLPQIPIRGYDQLPADYTNYDAVIYHLGADPRLVAIYRMFLQHPGIVVLHEVNLSPIFAEMASGKGNHKRFLWSVAQNDRIAAFVRALYRYGLTGRMPNYADVQMSRRTVRRSVGIIVHTEYARTLVNRDMPSFTRRIPVWLVPHGTPSMPIASPQQVMAARKNLGLTDCAFLVGVFGVVHENKRFSSIVRAFCRYHAGHTSAALVFVGHHQTEHQQYIDHLGCHDSVRLLGHVSLDDFYEYMIACDVCVGLRYPAFGEASGPLLRIMSLGKPVAVSDFAQFREFPDNVAKKIDIGDEENQLPQWFSEMQQNPGLRLVRGIDAHIYVHRNHSFRQSALSYQDALSEYLAARMP